MSLLYSVFCQDKSTVPVFVLFFSESEWFANVLIFVAACYATDLKMFRSSFPLNFLSTRKIVQNVLTCTLIL